MGMLKKEGVVHKMGILQKEGKVHKMEYLKELEYLYGVAGVGQAKYRSKGPIP